MMLEHSFAAAIRPIVQRVISDWTQCFSDSRLYYSRLRSAFNVVRVHTCEFTNTREKSRTGGFCDGS
jgi:hypothetical protein